MKTIRCQSVPVHLKMILGKLQLVFSSWLKQICFFLAFGLSDKLMREYADGRNIDATGISAFYLPLHIRRSQSIVDF